MNHIFVDYENIKNVDPKLFELSPATFTLLLGPQNKTLDVAVVEKLITLGGAIELVRLSEAGRNAVDFALAYYLGRKVAAGAHGRFHLVSNDKGYDPLIKHLLTQKLDIQRHGTYTDLLANVHTRVAGGVPAGAPVVQRAAKPIKASKSPGRIPVAPVTASKLEPDALLKALKYLQNGPRPKRRQTLLNHLHDRLGKGGSLEEAEDLLRRLQEGGHVQFDARNVVTYHLDPGSQ